MNIIKRTGQIVSFDKQKIHNAIRKAFQNSHESQNIENDCEKVTNDVTFYIENDLSVEKIQDLVEKCLMEDKFYLTAKRYILFREERNKERNNQNKQRKV